MATDVSADIAAVQGIAASSRRRPVKGWDWELYIASEITRAYGGRIDVTSSPEETRLTLRMPLSNTAD